MTKAEKLKKLIEKARAGGQVTAEELESMASTPSKICSPKTALEKAKKGIKLNEFELKSLASDMKCALEYAKFRGEPFPEFEEKLIEKGNFWTVSDYFKNVVKVPSKLYENFLLVKTKGEHTREICLYAAEVLKCRWPEGETFLLQPDEIQHALQYQESLSIGRWAELEKLVLKNGDSSDKQSYFQNCGLGRNESLENLLLKKGKGESLYLYARYCVRGKLPTSLHNKMILLGKKWSKKYVRMLESMKKRFASYIQSIGDSEREELFKTSEL